MSKLGLKHYFIIKTTGKTLLRYDPKIESIPSSAISIQFLKFVCASRKLRKCSFGCNIFKKGLFHGSAHARVFRNLICVPARNKANFWGEVSKMDFTAANERSKWAANTNLDSGCDTCVGPIIYTRRSQTSAGSFAMDDSRWGPFSCTVFSPISAKFETVYQVDAIRSIFLSTETASLKKYLSVLHIGDQKSFCLDHTLFRLWVLVIFYCCFT